MSNSLDLQTAFLIARELNDCVSEFDTFGVSVITEQGVTKTLNNLFSFGAVERSVTETERCYALRNLPSPPPKKSEKKEYGISFFEEGSFEPVYTLFFPEKIVAGHKVGDHYTISTKTTSYLFNIEHPSIKKNIFKTIGLNYDY